jgi:FMN-dependent oxidoreductase (nitrilotriacetate monooxygenase family)
MPKRFHLGWFCNFATSEWNSPLASADPRWDGKTHVELAQQLERACFDYILLEDTLMVSESHGGGAAATLAHAIQAPKHDPMPLAVLIAAATSHLGIVATMSTTAYPPFLLARLASTVDSISGGRFGWNIVTSGEDAAAQNFGMDRLPPRETRYAIADEFVDVVTQLFDSWEPGAVVMDRERGVYVDGSKVKPIHFKGEHFQVRGPLNTVRSPQGRPVYVQAGGSPRGREFAARTADSIVAPANGLEGMKAFRADIRARAKAAGRDPDAIKILFLVYPFLADTTEEARAKYQRMADSPAFIDAALASIGTITDIDFSVFDLDQELPRLTTNGESAALDKFAQWGSGKTLRQLVADRFESGLELIGTPDEVADKMERAMAEIGGDGFLLSTPFQRISRRAVAEVTEGLVPALQRRGLVRTHYEHTLLRDTLLEF